MANVNYLDSSSYGSLRTAVKNTRYMHVLGEQANALPSFSAVPDEFTRNYSSQLLQIRR